MRVSAVRACVDRRGRLTQVLGMTKIRVSVRRVALAGGDLLVYPGRVLTDGDGRLNPKLVAEREFQAAQKPRSAQTEAELLTARKIHVRVTFVGHSRLVEEASASHEQVGQ